MAELSPEMLEALEVFKAEFNQKLDQANEQIAELQENYASAQEKITELKAKNEELNSSIDSKIANASNNTSTVVEQVKEEVKNEIPKKTFKSSANSEGKKKEYRFLVPVIKLKNASSPITALAALEDQKILDEIVRLESGIIEEVV